MKILRVFPRKTNATPDDDMCRFGNPILTDEADEVHISVLFKWDLKKADDLAQTWKHVAPVKMGGVACGDVGGDFVPGMYVKEGYTITSRGCPNNCWFCDVWKREGNIREIPIHKGSNLLDSNILACSDTHIAHVLNMMIKQPYAEFTGGLEAARLKAWHVELFTKIRPRQMFFAYDTPDDYEPLVAAGKLLTEAGFTLKRKKNRCYVLCGYKGDTIDRAEKRMWDTMKAGFVPMAMYYKQHGEVTPKDWGRFCREWIRVAIIYPKIKKHLL